jgi:hypothetical protein
MAKRGVPGGDSAPQPGYAAPGRTKSCSSSASYFHHLNHRYGAEHNFQIQLSPRKVTEGQQFNGYKPVPAVREAVRFKKTSADPNHDRKFSLGY